MATETELYEMHSFSASSILRPHATVLNADAANCYITW